MLSEPFSVSRFLSTLCLALGVAVTVAVTVAVAVPVGICCYRYFFLLLCHHPSLRLDHSQLCPKSSFVNPLNNHCTSCFLYKPASGCPGRLTRLKDVRFQEFLGALISPPHFGIRECLEVNLAQLHVRMVGDPVDTQIRFWEVKKLGNV